MLLLHEMWDFQISLYILFSAVGFGFLPKFSEKKDVYLGSVPNFETTS